jgi:hypothetical protein
MTAPRTLYAVKKIADFLKVDKLLRPKILKPQQCKKYYLKIG